MTHPDKYHTLLVLVATMRKKQREYQRCKTSQGKAAMQRAEAKVDEIINAEVGKAIQIQQKMFG